ncbi:MAG: hypothetical protein ACMUIE_04790 [Thermoplasmatota archaeon]
MISDADRERLDKAMAMMLITPSSKSTLDVVRAVSYLRAYASENGVTQLEALHGDLLELHDVVLTLETDPEIVKKNMLARVMSAVFPFLNALEEFETLEDKTGLELLMDSLGIVSEIATATQYLEATRLSASAHLERSLVKVETRMTEMALAGVGEPGEKMVSVFKFMDDIRTIDIKNSQKPFIPLLLWISIVVISYKRVKESMDH